MSSLNKVQIIGRLGRDPEVRYTPAGEAIANLSVATGEKWKDKTTGEEKESTEWHRVNLFGRTAEVAGEHLKKGAQVYIEGALRTRKWQDKEGKDRFTTEIRGDRMLMLGGRSSEAGAPPSSSSNPTPGSTAGSPAKSAGKFDDMEDDIPFISCSLSDDSIFRKLRWGLD